MKRFFLIPLMIVLVSALILGACAKPAPPAAEPIKIGMLASFTGGLAGGWGETTAKPGWELALEELNYEIAGRPVELFYEDDGSFDAVKALDMTRKLVEVDQVDILFGPIASGSWVATTPYMNDLGRLQITYGWRGEAILWTPGQPRWDVLAAPLFVQFAYPAGTWAYEQGYRTAVTIGVDYETGYQGAGAFADAFTRAGGTVVQQVWPPFDTTDWGPYLASMEEADVVAIIAFGPDIISFVRQSYEFGLWDKSQVVLLSNDTYQEAQLTEAGDWVLGLVSATPYTWRVDNPVNNSFVADFEAKTGFKPGSSSGAIGYHAIKTVVALMEKTGGDTTQEVMRDAIIGLNIDSPHGFVTITEEGYALMDAFITEARKTVDGEYVWEVIETYNYVPYAGYYTKP